MTASMQQLPESLKPQAALSDNYLKNRIFDKQETSNSLAFKIKKDVNSLLLIIQSQKGDIFDPLVHNPARYDIYGNQKLIMKKPGQDPHNILVQKTTLGIPEWWSKPTDEIKTKTLLQSQRRQEKIPHPSFDLDAKIGDGIVGGRDYVIAKLFDKDKDGKLNQKEREQAIKALKSGYENNFFWNVEKSGANRPYRLLQKRGKFIDAEDYLGVRQTYPTHPMSNIEPKFKTKDNWKQYMKNQNRADLQLKKKAWDEANPAEVAQPFRLSEFLVSNPAHKTKTEIRKEKHRTDREKCGLTSHEVDIKVEDKDPGLNYLNAPQKFSGLQLKQQRKGEMLQELRQLQSKKHEDSLQRLMDRQQCYVRIGNKKQAGKTLRDIKQKFRNEMNQNNIAKFGKQTIGVHGQELPKFSTSQSDQQYWKKSNTFNQRPSIQSFKQLKQTQKYCKAQIRAKDDKYILNDINQQQANAQPFKDTYSPKKFKSDVAKKPNEIKHIPDTEQDLIKLDEERYYKQVKPNKRWTDQVLEFNKNKNSKERMPTQIASEKPEDYDPLFSSFSPDGVFRPPPASRDLSVLTQTKQASNQAAVIDANKPGDTTLISRLSQRKPWALVQGGAEAMGTTVRNTISQGIRSGGFQLKKK